MHSILIITVNAFFSAEHPAVQVFCPFWFDAHCRDQHLRLDQDGLQGDHQTIKQIVQ